MKPIEVLAVDFLSTLRVLRSVAAAKEISQSTKYGWRTTDLIASANMRGQVGMWEAEVPNGRQLKAAIQAETRERALHLIRVAGQGPMPLLHWLSEQTRLRDQYLRNYHEQMAAFGQINQSTLNALDASVKLIKTGRFVASVGLITGGVALALYGMGLTVSGTIVAAGGYGGAGTAVGVPLLQLTKSVSFAVIKDWNKSQNAKALSIAFESGKAGTNEALGRTGTAMTANAGVMSAASKSLEGDLAVAQEAQRKALQQAEQRVAEGQAKLARLEKLRIGGQSAKGAKAQATRVVSQRAAVEAERQAAARASSQLAGTTEQLALAEAKRLARAQGLRVWGRRVVGGATAAFAVWDLYDAVAELGE